MISGSRLLKTATTAVAVLCLIDLSSAIFFDKEHHDVHVVKVPYHVEKIIPVHVPKPIYIPSPPKTIIKKQIVKVPVKVPYKVPVKVRVFSIKN